MNDDYVKEHETELHDEIGDVNTVIVKTSESLPVTVIPETENPAKKRPDSLAITFAVLALAVIVGFSVYFYMYVKNNTSLKMTLNEFSSIYHKTDGYLVISSLGFSFPDCTISDLSPNEKKNSNERYFSGELKTMMSYEISVSGSINKSNDFIKTMQVSVAIPEDGDITELQSYACYYFMPFIQTLYPDMLTEDTVTFSQNLFTSQETFIRGDYAVSARVDEAAGFIYLNIVPKENA
jgi:hypothetical protein